MSERPAIRPGMRVRFPTLTKPWQSGVLRHRGLTIQGGAEGEVASKPFLVGQRGWQVDIYVPKRWVRRLFGQTIREPDAYRLRCSVKELEVMP